MLKYIIKRLLWLIPVMIGVITIVFVIQSMTPGDPVASILGSTATEEAREALRESLGLNKPLIQRWFDYVVGIFTRFDFGTSYTTSLPVRNELLTYAPVTIILALWGTLIGVVVGIPLGIFSALKQYTLWDQAILVLTVLMVSMPSFWLALLLIRLFSVNLGWLPSFGLTSWKGWILPIVICGIGSMTGNIRITRFSMLDVMRQDYINTARAKGQKEGVIITRHMLHNAMIPVMTAVGTGLSGAFGGNIAIETVFSLPGLGNYVTSAITARNYTAMLGGILFIALLFTLVNLLVDLLYVVVDPRLKSQIIGSSVSKRKQRKMLREAEGAR